MPPERSGRQTRATEREARATRRATRTRVGGSGPAAAVRHAGGRRDAPTSPASHSRTLSPKTTQLPAGEPIRATARERADGTTSCGIARLLVFLCLCGLSMQTRLPEQMHARICWWSAGSAARLKAVAWVCGRGLDGLPHWRRRDRCAKPAQATEDRASGTAQAGLGKRECASGIVQAALGKWDWARGNAQAALGKWDWASGIGQVGLGKWDWASGIGQAGLACPCLHTSPKQATPKPCSATHASTRGFATTTSAPGPVCGRAWPTSVPGLTA